MALECKYWRTIEMTPEKGHEDKRGSVVFGQVVGIHIDDRIIKDRPGRYARFQARRHDWAYSEYTTVDNIWKMRRPDDRVYQ